MQALLKHKFKVPKALRRKTNVAGTKYYDQIAFKLNDGELQRGDSEPNAGAFDFFRSVFRPKTASCYGISPGSSTSPFPFRRWLWPTGAFF